MKVIYLLCILFLTNTLCAQTVFEENFEDKVTGLDLSTEAYVLSHKDSYTGTVAATVSEDAGNKFARMVADVNAGADMQIAKTIDVEAGKSYLFKVESRGLFKRQLRVLSMTDEVLASSADYKPSTDAEGAAWKSMELSFTVPLNTSQVKIAFLHYWSGTIDLDNYQVEQTIRQTAYYLNSSEGDDDNAGTEAEPWLTLDKISATTLMPGDTVLFKCGDEFKGHYSVNGSGSADDPILITAYDEGDRPIINGQVGAEAGGDFQEAIRVENCDNIIFDGIEVKNERLVTRAGVRDTDAFGISIHNSGSKTMNNIVFRNLTVKDVFAVQPMLSHEDFDAIQVSGIRFTTAKNTVVGEERTIDGVLIEDSYFTNLQRLGIQFRGGGGNEGIGNDSINRIMNIEVRNNEFYYNGGTAVLPNGTYNCLIENNIFDHPGASTDPRMPARGSSVWTYKAMNTVVQYNMCLSTRGYLDSYGIHIDKHNTNTFVQYNYMDDCIGGFVEILANNIDAVYRFNVSVNSGFRYTDGVSDWKAGSSTIYIYSDRWVDDGLMLSDGVYVYNNTVVIDKPFTTTFNVDAKNMFIYNNIFSSTNGATMGHLQYAVRDNDTPFTMTHNLYEGDVNEEWVNNDDNPIQGNPKFTGVGEDKMPYELKEGSPAINTGTNITGPEVNNAGYGVFKNITPFPTVDFYGNPIDLASGKVNIGAFNGKPNDVSVDDQFAANTDWLVYLNQDSTAFNITSKSDYSGDVEVSLFSLNGTLIKNDKQSIDPSNNSFIMSVDSNVSNGIYILRFTGDGISHSRRILLYR
ncbi:T9SS type A sorting domain-containing protein [Saccharicrinis aurantiacus]|uniref:T9SS type A sorting domain-containing protein n=1 Tax=Saccharicrinis aurantiacus TaxID=1849719 RepID=UPI0008382A90|nr:right-handed parallel beta-helix repeat-containing protein [Saccharicrinis aurantiacus]